MSNPINADGFGIMGNGVIMTGPRGEFFDVLNPSEYLISIDVIAHALSKIERATGHYSRTWSVAEHSILVSRICYYLAKNKYECSEPRSIMTAIAGLLHDGSEAYIADLARPIKYAPGVEGYLILEKPLQDRIYYSLWGGQFTGMLDVVKEADNEALKFEFRNWMPGADKMPWCHDTGRSNEELCRGSFGNDFRLDREVDWTWIRDEFKDEYGSLIESLHNASTDVDGVSVYA